MTMMFASLLTVITAVAMRMELRRRSRRKVAAQATVQTASNQTLQCPVCGGRHRSVRPER
jgi:hypothetical protein